MKKGTQKKAGENILKAQEKQQWDYNRCHVLPGSIKPKHKVWLKKQERLENQERREIFLQMNTEYFWRSKMSFNHQSTLWKALKVLPIHISQFRAASAKVG